MIKYEHVVYFASFLLTLFLHLSSLSRLTIRAHYTEGCVAAHGGVNGRVQDSILHSGQPHRGELVSPLYEYYCCGLRGRGVRAVPNVSRGDAACIATRPLRSGFKRGASAVPNVAAAAVSCV